MCQEGGCFAHCAHTQKKRCFLKLCFFSVSDLKSASHEFMRIGLRCTSLPTADNRSSLKRTSSALSVAASSQSSACSRERRAASPPQMSGFGSVRTASTAMPAPRQPPAASTSLLKRTYSEGPNRPERIIRRKRRQTSMAHDAHSPSLLRRGSSSTDLLATRPAHPAHSAPGSRCPLRNPTRGGNALEGLLQDPVRAPSPLDTVDEPPPRRELPQSITRHLAPSRTDGNNSQNRPGPERLSRSTSGKIEKAATTEMEVQTDEQFVEPETALFAGMELFQELAGLKDRMLQECLRTTRLLGGTGGDEAEARLVARYALDFQTRFTAICAQRASACMSYMP